MTSSSLNIDNTGKKRSQWLEDISAYLADGYELTEYGKSRIKTVLFTDQEAPLELLSFVWSEYDIYSDAIIQWLLKLGEHSNAEVRLRAAAVVGQLAIYEFRPIREKIILPWARSKKRSLQRLAALALTVVAYDENEEVAQQAVNLLHHWSTLRSASRLHWTSVEAYGGYIGILLPQQAFDNLKLIIQSGNGLLFSDIAQAIANLFEAGHQLSHLHLLVLTNLSAWVKEDIGTATHRLGLLIFWGLAHDSWFAEDNENEPILLSLAKQDQEIEDTVISLIRSALNVEFSRDLMLPELLKWLKFVDQKHSSYKTLARIFFALASPGKERERIDNYLNRWSKHSGAATRILHLIKNNS